MELNKKGKKLQAEGVKYGDIDKHYKRSDFVDKRYWKRVTKPYIRERDTVPLHRVEGGKIEGGYAIDPYTEEKFDPKEGHGDHYVANKEMFESQFEGMMLTPAQKKRAGHYRKNIGLVLAEQNMAKGAKDLANWQPEKNVKPFALKIESVKKALGLAMDPKEAEAFKKITGRKTKTWIKPKLSTTLYCTSCHINHSINEHN